MDSGLGNVQQQDGVQAAQGASLALVPGSSPAQRGETLMERLMTFGRVLALSLVLVFGSAGVTSVAAQDTVVEEAEDEGFDDWGLLGLLGLAGLLGLKRREPEVHTTVTRPIDTPR